ncbi:putative 2-hydroxyacyl-CoA lyase [Cyberlindnera fabianii]|uniref:2-hydroxyacyl-CoA lyase n=1 Tax=Cyberlindnera fabianii TaxID=36022 RepID=A0A1V2L6X7_CYBFA|nr:putative 2-hydroxyacyl-CoA lyase [Cyberlindnera fabianii]
MSSGAQLIALSLKKLGVTTVFGIVGIPIVEVGDALIKEGVRFIAFRNEQAASYAASAYGYLTGKPGVLLVVGGPGIIHALPGVLNARSNKWPLLVLAGSSSFSDVSKGGFQELDQVSAMEPWTKLSLKPTSFDQVPLFLYKAYKASLFGTPGATYIDLPADIVENAIEVDRVQNLLGYISEITPQHVPRSLPPPERLQGIAELIKSAKSPLVVIGKGAAYSEAHQEIRELVESHNLPFLPTPMGKGVVSDHSDLNVSSARSQALKSADIVLLLGARLNWILHFGESPRYSESVKFIQVDSTAEEIGHNSISSLDYGLLGDIKLITKQLHNLLGFYKYPGVTQSMKTTIAKNNSSLKTKETTVGAQLNYNNVYKVLRELISPRESDTILVSEGANTMDIARISFPQSTPKNRLDAGTNATMGVGMGYALAAKVVSPGKTVVAIEGDSAFGFSAMEVETAVRAHLPLIVVVMNNSGIYHGVPETVSYAEFEKLPSTALSKETRYDLLGQSLGAEGYTASTIDDVKSAFSKALKNSEQGKTTVINVIISPGTKKKIGFGWQNKKATKL